MPSPDNSPTVRVESRVAPAPAPPSRWAGTAAWLPALLLIVVLAASILGIEVVPRAQSATSGIVDVGGTQAVQVLVNPSCASTAIPALTPGDAVTRESPVCTMGFGTNWVNGADLMIEDLNDLGPGTMRCIVASCGASTLPELGGHPANPTATSPNSFFGVRLTGSASLTPDSPAVVTDYNVNGGAAGTGDYYDVLDAPDIACHTTGTGLWGQCSFRFAARAGAVQPGGTYQADVRFEAFQR